MPDKIKVLFLAANPADVAYRPNLDQEARQIFERIQLSALRDQFEFITQWAVRPEDLQEALLRFKPDIVHFSGHGSRTQGIILQDYAGNLVPVSKNALAGLFKILKDNIRVVVLNACHSRSQTEGICQTIDYTVGMKKAVGDQAAIVFSASFYQGLAFGRTVTESFNLAKNQLEIMGITESKTPVLTVRDGVNPLEPFLHEDQQPGSDKALAQDSTLPNYGAAQIIKDDAQVGQAINVLSGSGSVKNKTTFKK